jgi:hypothetical protein
MNMRKPSLSAMHILEDFLSLLDASPSLWMLWTLCLVAALLTGCWCVTWSLERRIQAQLQGSRIELGAQLQDLERKITAIFDELRRARALSHAALGTCGPASVDNELSRSSGPRKALQAPRRVSSDGDSTRASSLARLACDDREQRLLACDMSQTRLSSTRLLTRLASSDGDDDREQRLLASDMSQTRRARRASIRCGEGLAAAEGAGPMLSRGGARGASASGGVLPARQTDAETLALSTLAPRVKPLAYKPEHFVQVTVTSSRSRGSLKRTPSLDSAQVASRGSNKRLSPEGTPIARHRRHLDQRGLQQPDRRTDLASAITAREPDVFKRTHPSGRSTEDSASSSIQRPESPGQRWRPLVLHEQSWQDMRPKIIARTSSLPSSGRAPDDDLDVFGERISLTPPRDHIKFRTGFMPG